MCHCEQVLLFNEPLSDVNVCGLEVISAKCREVAAITKGVYTLQVKRVIYAFKPFLDDVYVVLQLI